MAPTSLKDFKLLNDEHCPFKPNNNAAKSDDPKTVTIYLIDLARKSQNNIVRKLIPLISLEKTIQRLYKPKVYWNNKKENLVPLKTGKNWQLEALTAYMFCNKTNAASCRLLQSVGCKNDFLTLHHYALHIEVAIVLRFLRSRHGKEEWDSDSHYNAFTETSDTDVAKWARGGSAAAAILFVLGKINDFPSYRESSGGPRLWGCPHGDTKPDDFFNGDEDDVAADDGIHDPDLQLREEHVRSTLKNRSLGGLVKVLLVQIYWRSSAIFSTTHRGAGPLVRKFIKTANEYFQDEAGCATVPESLQLWRMDRRLVMVGDPKQLAPPILSAGARYDTRGRTHSINPLAPQHILSLLYHVILSGFLVFVLRVQRRMVRGLFNLSKHIFCNRLGLPDNQMELSYSETSDISSGHHNLSLSCEEWARRELGVAPTGNGRTLPVFIDVSGTQVQYTEVSKSRSNGIMTDVLIRVLNRLGGVEGLGLGDIAIVTPYVA